MLATNNISPLTQKYLEREERYGAHNYHPLPVVLSRGEGVFVYDVDNKRYYDFLSGYSLTFSYNFALGPLEISTMYCDQTNKLQWYINLGIPF